MAVRVEKSQLPVLLSWLERHLPTSFKIYNEVKSHIRGRFPHLEVYVDRWPDPSAAIARVDPANQLEFRKYYDNLFVGVFCTEGAGDALDRLLSGGHFVDWTRPVCFSVVSEPIWRVLKALMEKRGQRVELAPGPFIVLQASPKDLHPVPVPEGMKIVPVTDDTSDVVSSTFSLSRDGVRGMVREVTRRLPSAVLMTQEGTYVGCMIRRTHGVLSMLHIEPPFRRKGYAKVIISHLSQTVFDDGDSAFVMISEGNEPSLQLHVSMGFKPVPGFRVCWLSGTPGEGNN